MRSCGIVKLWYSQVDNIIYSYIVCSLRSQYHGREIIPFSFLNLTTGS